MSTSRKSRKIRRDGWTPERQLRFLDALAQCRSVGKAAAFVGMSREGAYRLSNRSDGTLFALLWDRVLGCDPGAGEVHNRPLTDGRIARLLGNHFRRERGDFVAFGSGRQKSSETDPTVPL
jgi:hypothetical protein